MEFCFPFHREHTDLFIYDDLMTTQQMRWVSYRIMLRSVSSWVWFLIHAHRTFIHTHSFVWGSECSEKGIGLRITWLRFQLKLWHLLILSAFTLDKQLKLSEPHQMGVTLVFLPALKGYCEIMDLETLCKLSNASPVLAAHMKYVLQQTILVQFHRVYHAGCMAGYNWRLGQQSYDKGRKQKRSRACRLSMQYISMVF